MWPGVPLGDIARRKNFVGELGAGFKGEGFGEDEGVVAVEEEGCYLGVVSLLERGLGGERGGEDTFVGAIVRDWRVVCFSPYCLLLVEQLSLVVVLSSSI